jgi:shikimate kinase
MRPRHVVLIGLPGAGKTSIGRHLAKLLDRPFADADEQLELSAGRTIPRLAREEGDELSRREARTLADLVGREGPLVIAASGAVEIDRENRALLARSAVVLWIRGSIRLLTELSDPTHRPRLADGHQEALVRLDGELSAVYAEVADHIVDVEPFHALDDEPRRTIARHVAGLLTTGRLRGAVRVPDEGSPTNGDRHDHHDHDHDDHDDHDDQRRRALARIERELAALYAEVADHIVDVEPFHAAADDQPKRTIARHVAGLLAPDGDDPRPPAPA